MKFTVLGCSTPVPQAGNPCSGYLVSSGDTTVLVDCGSGVFAALAQRIDPGRLSAVWISHLHPDHSADLATLANWALNTEAAPRLPVFGPEKWASRLNSFISQDPSVDLVGDIFDVQHIADGTTTIVGDLTLTSRAVSHSVTAYGLRIADADGASLAYSGDTGPCASLGELAAGVGLFVCEAGTDTPADYHLTAHQAYDIASTAKVRRLVLTHIPAGATADLPHAAGGLPVEAARSGAEWLVTSL